MDLFGDLPPPATTPIEKKDSKNIDEMKKGMLKRLSTDNADEIINKKSKDDDLKQDGQVTMKSYKAEIKGERDEMQDAATLIDDCSEEYNKCECSFKIKHASYFGVYDGHGGKRASAFVKDNLHVNIRKLFPKGSVENFAKEMKRCLVQAFKETDDQFLNKASKESPAWRDGSTVSCVLILNHTLYAANVGDTKTILVRENVNGKNSIIPLSKDHSPTLYEERQRVQNAGGVVREGRVQGVLEVSRAIGDARFKKYVISTPDIFKSTITTKDRYILMACDGLWKVFTVTEAVEYIDNKLNSQDIEDIDDRYQSICKDIASEAVRKGSGDNVTVVLVRFVHET